MSRWGYKEYVPASVKKEKIAKSLAKLKKKNPGLAPVQLSGRKLARTWWGEAWNENLEKYADYSNRIERGRSYVRQGAVLHLQIEPGKVSAIVQGSRIKPYDVAIYVDPLEPVIWQRIISTVSGSINSLQDLLAAKFPSDLADLFTIKGKGLFPSPDKIHLICNCPDSAGLCKHLAAVLYGIGARLDEDPALFFVLRQVDVKEMISDALNQTSDKLLASSSKTSNRAILHDDISALFGIDIANEEEAARLAEAQEKPPAKKRGRPPKNKESRADKDETK